MTKYKIEYSMAQYCNIYRRNFILFGLIPIGWELAFRHDEREKLADWIDNNVLNIDERINLKLKL